MLGKHGTGRLAHVVEAARSGRSTGSADGSLGPHRGRRCPEAADEYDSYVGAIGERLRSHESANELAAYLTWVQADRMGLTATDAAAANDLAVANELLSWYQQEMTSAD
jgi:hypothetical protein